LNAADRVLAVARGKDGYDQEGSSLVTKTTHVTTKTPEFKFQQLQFLEAIYDLRVWLLSGCFLFVYSSIDFMSVLVPEVTADTFGLGLKCITNCTGKEGHVSLVDGVSMELMVLSMIPFLLAFGCALYCAPKSDDTGDRITFAASFVGAAAVGFFFVAVSHPSNLIRYFLGVLPIVIGLTCSLPFIMCLAMDWAMGDTQRATVASLLVSLGSSFGQLVTALQQLSHQSEFVSQSATAWISFGFLVVALGLLAAVHWLQQKEQQDSWGKAPGLRRLLNDVEETKAWDVELNNLEYLKSQPIEFGYESTDKAWTSTDEL
jgi:cadmium resistance protein CadD (predicted permease)